MADITDDPLVFTFFNEIGIIGQLSQNLLERSLPRGLKLSHLGILNHFARLGGEKKPVELARAFQVTKGAITNTLQRLEAGGLIEVRPDPRDGRGKLAAITDKGLRVRNEAVQALAPAVREVAAQFGTKPFRDALPFLQQLRIHLDRARDTTDRLDTA